MKTALLVHGIHLYADKWEDIVWGNLEIGILGIVPKALAVACELKAEYMVWGTGASERDGLKEADYTFKFAMDKANAYMFRALGNFKHHIDRISQNTREEIAAASEFAVQNDIERLILVSNPTHIARCLQTALAYFGEHNKYNTLRRNLTVAVSNVCFADSNPSDVVIFEPPHRGDRPKRNTHKLARAVMELSRNGGTNFNFFLAEWRNLIAKFGGDKLV